MFNRGKKKTPVDSIKEVLPGGKAPTEREIDKQEKSQVDEARARSQAICNRLKMITYIGCAETISPDNVRFYQGLHERLIDKLDNVGVLRLDTTSIDNYIYVILDTLKGAIHSGSEETIMHCYKALAYGIGKAREDLMDKDEHRKDAVIRDRTNTMARFTTITELAERVDETTQSLNKQLKERQNAEQAYNKANEKVHELYENQEDLIISAREVAYKSRAQLTGKQLELKVRLSSVLNRRKEMDLLDQTMALWKQRKQSYSDSIRMMQNQLALFGQALDEDQMEEMDRLQKDFNRKLLEAQEESKRLDELNNGMNRIMEAILSSPDTTEGFVRTLDEYEALLEREKKEKENAVEGRKILNEQAQDNEQENEELLAH